MSTRLEDEEDAWKEYLAHGWEAEWGDQVSQDPSGVKMDSCSDIEV
jgi:hypothetical protein